MMRNLIIRMLVITQHVFLTVNKATKYIVRD